MRASIARFYYDIIIIGGGGAGAQAVLSVIGNSGRAKVALVDKGIFGRSGCTILGGFSCNAALGYKDPRDNPAAHFEDTVREGRYINDQNLVKIYTEKAPERVEELQKLGPVFETENGKIKQEMVPGHSFPRAAFNNLHTGRSMILALKKEVLRRDIDIYDECVIFDILCRDNSVCGALGYDMNRGRFMHFGCKAVIVTTGGCGQLYENTTTSRGSTGDGLALAYHAGAAVQDMEFIQFFPTAQCYPRLLRLNPTFPSMLRYRAGCRLYNSEGTEFMKDRMPDWRFNVTRDELAHAIYEEIRNGRGSPHGGVFMDVLHLSEEEIVDTFSFANMFGTLLKMGIDLRKDSIETTVAAHFSMGGIRVNETFATCVEGLFAAGEAVAGIHGANRLPGNALSEILVTGHEAGMNAVTYSESKEHESYDEDKIDEKIRKKELLLKRKGGIDPISLKKRVRKLMWENVGVIRDGPELSHAVSELKELRNQLGHMCVSTKTYVWNKELVDAIEAEFMITVALLIAEAAHCRKESRGAHFRKDYPQPDKGWLVNIVLKEGSMRTESLRKTRMLGE
jgi:succinate dehydrogenase/fumarate reductase flavoprotein subunit